MSASKVSCGLWIAASLSACSKTESEIRQEEVRSTNVQIQISGGRLESGKVDTTLVLHVKDCDEPVLRSIVDPTWDGPGYVPEIGPPDIERWVRLGFKTIECGEATTKGWDNVPTVSTANLPASGLTGEQMSAWYRILRKRYARYDIHKIGVPAMISWRTGGVDDRALVIETTGRCDESLFEVPLTGGATDFRVWTASYPAASVGFHKLICSSKRPGASVIRELHTPVSMPW